VFLFASPLFAQQIEIPKGDLKPFPPVDQAELLARYPKGKTWQSMSVLRVSGTASSETWGIKGDVQFMQSNRYHTQFKILDNRKFGESRIIKLRCDIIDASSSKVKTKSKLQMTGFNSSDPIFNLAKGRGLDAMILAMPELIVVVTVLKKWEQVDPNYQRTLTAVADKLGINADQLTKDKELEWIENPRAYTGCSFELEWENGVGVTKVEQVKNASGETVKTLSKETIQRWAIGADPLAELYVYPSLNRKVGDAWTLDASRASSLFAGQGDARTMGEINLRQENDAVYDGTLIRNVSIRSGDIRAVVEEDGQETRYEMTHLNGRFQLGSGDAMLRMANGTGTMNYSRFSTDHWLFKAELSRDVSAQWRYESERVPK